MISAPPTGLEGIALRTSIDEVVAQLAAAGWKHNMRPAQRNPDQRTRVFPGPGPVARIDLAFEDQRLIGLDVKYRAADPERRHRFEGMGHQRELGGWFFADLARTVMVYVSPDGRLVRLLHTGVMRDRREAEAMFRTFLGLG